MAEFFLKLGYVNKKLILLTIATVLYIIMDIIEYTTNMKDLHFVLDLYTRGISYTGIIIVPLVQKCCDKRNQRDTINKKSQCTKKSILHFSFLVVGYILYFIVHTFLSGLKKDIPKEDITDFQMSHYHGLCTEEAIEIIIILIISKILLRTKLYIHHCIGLIIFIIFSFCIDVLLQLSIFKPGAKFFFSYCLFLILDSFFITYEKYLMDIFTLYYSIYNWYFIFS